MNFPISLVSALILCALLAPSALCAQIQITLAGMDDPLTHTSMRVLEEAYERIGIEAIYVPYPPFRGLKVANRGITDGEVSRVPNLQTRYTNLRMIPVAVNRLEELLVTRKATFEFKTVEQLTPFTIAIQRGIKIEERLTEGLQRTAVSNLRQKLYMLSKGRIDFIIASRVLGQAYLRENPVEQIRFLDPPLIQIDLFHYLHKNHESLILPLTQTLQTMEKEGRIAQIRQQFFEKSL